MFARFGNVQLGEQFLQAALTPSGRLRRFHGFLRGTCALQGAGGSADFGTVRGKFARLRQRLLGLVEMKIPCQSCHFLGLQQDHPLQPLAGDGVFAHGQHLLETFRGFLELPARQIALGLTTAPFQRAVQCCLRRWQIRMTRVVAFHTLEHGSGGGEVT
ncbi:hypothetical protein D3C81_926530 [compost metagenome]